MATLFQFSAVFCACVCLAIAASNLFRKNYLLTSWRNLFLAGFAYFFGMGGYFTVDVYKWSVRFVASDRGFFLLAVAMPVFLFVFLLFSHFGFKFRWATRFIPKVELPPTVPGIVVSASVLLGIAFFFALVPPTSIVGLLAFQFRTGMAATATGLMLYWALCHRYNPVAWALFVGTLVVATLVGITGGGGRRAVLGVFLIVPWVYYLFDRRFKNSFGTVMRFAALALAAFLALAFYSRFRHGGQMTGVRGVDMQERIAQITDALQNPYIHEDTVDLMLYTDTANNTMFILETYPSDFAFMPLHGAYWLVVNPIPRFFWPGKPIALGEIIQKQMESPANLGPGIIGHGWSEFGWAGVLYYAAFFGVLCGVVDRALTDRVRNPYFCIVIACGAGNVLAIPRGDTPLFLIQVAAAVISTMTVLYVIKISLGTMLGAFAPVFPQPLEREDRERSDDDPYDPYEPDESYEQDRAHDDDDGY